MRYFIIFIFLLSVSIDARWIKVGDKELFFKLPSSWKSQTDVLNIPLVLLGPKVGKSRTSIAVIPYDKNDVRLPKGKHLVDEEIYESQRRKWVKKLNGKWLSRVPASIKKWDNVEAQIIGHRYSINGIKYQEKSFYVLCKKSLYLFKSLERLGHSSTGNNNIDKVLGAFECR